MALTILVQAAHNAAADAEECGPLKGLHANYAVMMTATNSCTSS